MKKEKILINNKEYDLDIDFEEIKWSRASITKTGIHIRIPLGMPRDEQFKEILRLKHWATEKIKEKQPKFKEKGSRTYCNGERLMIGNEEYFLNLFFQDKQSSSARMIGNEFYINVSRLLPENIQQKHISVLLSRLVAQKKNPYIKNKIKILNEKHFNFTFKKVFLKYNSSNWGSCSQADNINISTRSLFAPEDVIDYVCIHELAHIKEKNHSPAFWELVEKAMPNYEEKKQWLKDNSDKCWF